MTRSPLALLLAVAAAACGSASKPPIANHSLATFHYSLQPLRLHGGEGMHSASQSWTTIGGTLDLDGTRATLRLDLTTSRSFIHCPPDWDTRTSMDACAPPDARDTTDTNSVALRGEVRADADKLRGELTDGHDVRVRASCAETATGLVCSIDDQHTLFGYFGDRPSELVFTSAARTRGQNLTGVTWART